MTFKMNDEKAKIALLSSKLNALSPLNVLSRGYAIAYNDNKPIKSVSDVKKGDNIKIQVTDGEFFAEVKGS